MRYDSRHGGMVSTSRVESHSTPVTYTKNEIRKIRRMMASDTLIECPRCRDMLHDVGVIAESGPKGQLIGVSCAKCNRMAILMDVTSELT